MSVPSSLLVRSAWVCPIATPAILDGWVHVEGDRVMSVGYGTGAPVADRTVDLGSAVLLPGLVNAHTHLELSHLRGRVPPTTDFLAWVGRLMAERASLERADQPHVMEAIRAAVVEMQASGTVAVGDIANALVSPPVLDELGLPGVVFHELLGFAVTDGDRVVASGRGRRRALERPGIRVVPAAHAPFSVSPELFGAIRDEVRSQALPITSVHVGESPEEVQLLKDGTGPWRDRLMALGVWREDWTSPGSGPGDYLCDLGVIGQGTLVVHGVQLTDRELGRLAEVGATLVTCPRSNEWVGVGPPPVARFFASGVRVAVGTDSLASSPDLNLFGELAALRRLTPDVPARRLVDAATRGGAEALGLGDQFGSIAVGRAPRFIAVDLPAGTRDPEEALVSDVDPLRIRHWPFTPRESRC